MSQHRPTLSPMLTPWSNVFEVLALIEKFDTRWTENPTFPESPRPSTVKKLPK